MAIRLVTSLVGSLFFCGTLLAQVSDPFGGAPGSDPFGGGAEAAKPTVRTTKVTGKTTEGLTAEQSIRKKLSLVGEGAFVDKPLREAVAELSQAYDVPILVDVRSLEEIGLSATEPVNLSLTGVSLRSFLTLMLRDLELTYMIKNEILIVTTIEAAEMDLIARVYPIPDSIIGNAEQLVEAIHGAVVPDTWDLLGGPSTITVVGQVLVVSSIEAVHEQVVDLIQQIDAVTIAQNPNHPNLE
ncbi:DUF4974 domain-containing protein [Rubripirellula tenax]|nr:DUF4974 domain-containing protein [Rubripirellula tenax]